MVFVSKRRQFRIVLKPTAYVLDAIGQKVIIPGITVGFTNGRFETEDPELISLLLNNVHKGNQYTPVDNEEEWLNANPRYRHGPVQMVTGASATANVPPAVAGTQGPLREAASKAETPVVDLEKMIEEKIGARLSPLMDKIDRLLMVSEPTAPAPKPKKVFTCPVPGCGQVFRTGIEVGEHKRAAHTAPVISE